MSETGPRSRSITEDFKIRVDKLVDSYIKTAEFNLGDDSQGISDHLKSWVQLLNEIKVWPASKEILQLELISMCNYLVIFMALRLNDGLQVDLMSTATEKLVCHTLRRVSQCALKTSQMQRNVDEKEHDMESEMKKIVDAVKDPISHFRLLDILGRSLVLCSMCCLYRKKQGYMKKIQETLNCVLELKSMASQTVLEEHLPSVQGLMFCISLEDEKNVDCGFPSVGDVVRLVLKSFKVNEEADVAFKPWHWLDTLLQCEDLMKSRKYLPAMKKLEALLTTSLDPGQKSKLLCLFAKCYLSQGCPQLAIQTYRAALSVNKANHNVLYELANVYSILGLADLELESLNLLVRLLTDKHMRRKPGRVTTEIDAMIMSVCQIMPEITLPTALCHFARRCFQLNRYKVAAEQYLTLLRLLDDIESHSLEAVQNKAFFQIDVRELIVDTAEALVMAEQYTECISLSDEFYSYLSMEGDSVNESQTSDQAFSIDLTLESPPAISGKNSSQQSLFSQFQGANANTKRLTPELERDSLSSANCENYLDTEINSDNKTVLTQRCIQNLCNMSRKRMRSASTRNNDNTMCLTEEDAWLPKSLAVRLLLSKTDALVASQGFTEDTMDCLTKAYKTLLSSKIPVFKSSGRDNDTLPPSQKRRRLNTEEGNEGEFFVGICGVEDSKTSSSTEECTAFGQEISSVWSKTMVMIAERMGRASLKRRQFPSVLNTCRLILQLEPGNINGHYLKTLVLRDQGNENNQISQQWLQVRGIQSDVPQNELEAAIKDKQAEINKEIATKSRAKRKWWETSQLKLLSLDAACMNDILQHS